MGREKPNLLEKIAGRIAVVGLAAASLSPIGGCNKHDHDNGPTPSVSWLTTPDKPAYEGDSSVYVEVRAVQPAGTLSYPMDVKLVATPGAGNPIELPMTQSVNDPTIYGATLNSLPSEDYSIKAIATNQWGNTSQTDSSATWTAWANESNARTEIGRVFNELYNNVPPAIQGFYGPGYSFSTSEGKNVGVDFAGLSGYFFALQYPGQNDSSASLDQAIADLRVDEIGTCVVLPNITRNIGQKVRDFYNEGWLEGEK